MRLAPPVAALIAAAALVAASCSSSNGPQPAPDHRLARHSTAPRSTVAMRSASPSTACPTPPAGPGAPPGWTSRPGRRPMQACARQGTGTRGSRTARAPARRREPLLLQPGQRAVRSQLVDHRRHAPGQRTVLVEHDPELLDVVRHVRQLADDHAVAQARPPRRTRSAGRRPERRSRRCSARASRRRWWCRPRRAGRHRPRLRPCSWSCPPGRPASMTSARPGRRTPAAGDVFTATTACVTSKYGEEKSTAPLR